MHSLAVRMGLLTTIIFGVVCVVVVFLLRTLGLGNLYMCVGFVSLITIIQYLIGPKIVEMSMRVQYPKRQEFPWLFDMVDNLARTANVPTPRIGISSVHVPNAFAFGRSVRDGRVCVTKGILDLLNREELCAVLGHELGHIKNRDVLFITFFSVIPIVLYHVFYNLTYARRRDSGSGNSASLGLVALLLYFITNLLVLYLSRIREYYADKTSVSLGNAPSALASALYQLVYGAAKVPKEELRVVEGVKAFFLNDVSRGRQEMRDLVALDLDRSGTIDPFELKALREQEIKLN
ncbi:MAG: M48 family metalloprotease, partial [Candidatus Omnitrophica bacterium]|nr:M48 family metalloprotease [Candidatus Omnitrophota bacterium]